EPEHTRIAFGDLEVYPAEPTEAALAGLVEHLRGSEVRIDIDLGIAVGAFTVYGCDLTEGYVRLNSAYTTSPRLNRSQRDDLQVPRCQHGAVRVDRPHRLGEFVHQLRVDRGALGQWGLQIVVMGRHHDAGPV